MSRSFPHLLLGLLAIVTLFGCRGPGDGHPPHEEVGFGGQFVSVDDPEVSLTVHQGRFMQGSQAVHISGVYHAHRIDDNTYELHVSYEGRFDGIEETLIFRCDGDRFRIRSADSGEEAVFKRSGP